MEMLLTGIPFTMLNNVVYAVPASPKITIFTDATTPTIQMSDTAAFTANVVLTLANGSAAIGSAFIRVTTGNTLVLLKKS